MSFLLMLVAFELYPVMVMSTVDPTYSITVYNAASSENSLRIMLNITAIGAPLVLIYTVFVYRTFWGKVKMDETSY
jgi:cytochrome d ubiquinol oxidase subunit II